MNKIRSLLSVLLLGISGLASASLVGTDVPDALLVDRGGLEWAWVSPCSPFDPSCGAALTMHHGFSVATASDFAASFSGFQDLYNAFNPTPSVQLCASAYFNSGYSHCDNGNVNPADNNLRVWNAPTAWGLNIMDAYSEAFVVRTGQAVPEPGTLGLLGLGFAALGLLRRRRNQA